MNDRQIQPNHTNCSYPEAIRQPPPDRIGLRLPIPSDHPFYAQSSEASKALELDPGGDRETGTGKDGEIVCDVFFGFPMGFPMVSCTLTEI